MNKELTTKVQKVRELSNRINSLENVRKDINQMTEIRINSSHNRIERCTAISTRDGELFKKIRYSIANCINFDMICCETELREIFEQPDNSKSKNPCTISF